MAGLDYRTNVGDYITQINLKTTKEHIKWKQQLLDYTKKINLRLTGISECLSDFLPQRYIIPSTFNLKEETLILAHSSQQFQFKVIWLQGRIEWQVHGGGAWCRRTEGIRSMQEGKQRKIKRGVGEEIKLSKSFF